MHLNFTNFAIRGLTMLSNAIADAWSSSNAFDSTVFKAFDDASISTKEPKTLCEGVYAKPSLEVENVGQPPICRTKFAIVSSGVSDGSSTSA
jgi:hypothetical protein